MYQGNLEAVHLMFQYMLVRARGTAATESQGGAAREHGSLSRLVESQTCMQNIQSQIEAYNKQLHLNDVLQDTILS